MLLSACGASVAMETNIRASGARLHALHRLLRTCTRQPYERDTVKCLRQPNTYSYIAYTPAYLQAS